MRVIHQASRVSVVLGLAFFFSACGSSGVSGVPDPTVQGQDNGQVINNVPVVTGGYAAYPISFKTVGMTTTGGPSAPVCSNSLRTDTKLIVKASVTAATRNENTPVYTNYTANYSCATLRVTLQMEQGGQFFDFASVDTGRLAVPNTPGCAGSVPSQNIDFSAYMLPGHGNVRIKVEALTSNVNCLQSIQYPYRYPWNYAAVCANNPMQSIYQYHVVNGNLEVQVNGTEFVNN